MEGGAVSSMTGSAPVVSGAAPPTVELIEITKAFPGVLANDAISLTVRGGEVLCLLGENGAGKSTLMSILSGMYRPDSGRILVDGRPVELVSPRRALDLGIGMVYQHVTLVPTLTVLENLMLGRGRGLALDRSGALARLAELAGRLGVELDPDAVTGRLALGQQQQVEIVKALWSGSRVLILDEPTTMLTPQGIADLQAVIAQLRGHGLAIVLITHKLHEAVAMGDRVAVLKQGRVVGGIETAELRAWTNEAIEAEIVRLMFGDAPREEEAAAVTEDLARRPRRELPDEAVLELAGVAAGEPGEVGLTDVSLSIRPGEILGVAGVDGNGQRVLAEVISGQLRPSAGTIRLDGRSIERLDVAAREALGVRHVTDDRLGEGTVGSMSVAVNLVLKQIGRAPFWRRGVTRRRAIERNARELVREYDVRTPTVATRTANLSGGNVQKVLLARELSFGPRLVVFNKPTHGLDVRTAVAVRGRIRELADSGTAAVVISTELEELAELADRILVLSRGRVAGVVDNGPGAERHVGELMVGGRPEAPA